jgi:hypothetical protein
MLAICIAVLTGPAAVAEENPEKAAATDRDPVVVDSTRIVQTAAFGFVEAEPVDESGGFPWGRVVLGLVAVGLVVGLVYQFRRGVKRMDLSWRAAYGWAFLIFFYFVVTTTWFPSWLLSQQSVAGAPGWVSDLIGSAAWFVPLAIGLVALRWLQKTERI